MVLWTVLLGRRFEIVVLPRIFRFDDVLLIEGVFSTMLDDLWASWGVTGALRADFGGLRHDLGVDDVLCFLAELMADNGLHGAVAFGLDFAGVEKVFVVAVVMI